MKTERFACFLLTLLRIIWSTHCANSCHKVKIFNDSECAALDFESDDDGIKNCDFILHSENDSIQVVVPSDFQWKNLHLRFAFQNSTNQTCKQITANTTRECTSFKFTHEDAPYRLDIKGESLVKNYVFFPPKDGPFAYVDYTETSLLRLRVQKSHDVSEYKIRAFKIKHRKRILEDLRMISDEEDVSAVLSTYNEEGRYFFTVSGNHSRTITPEIYIGRKITRMVVGIVGASFILPFVMFVFHVLTRKYSITTEDGLKIIIIYHSAFTKHDQVVCALGKFLARLPKCQILDIINANKNAQNDSLTYATHVIYVNSPKNRPQDCPKVEIAEAQMCTVAFDYCEQSRDFNLFQDFDKFLKWLKVSDGLLLTNYSNELKDRVEEARQWSEIPVVIVTNESEPLMADVDRECTI